MGLFPSLLRKNLGGAWRSLEEAQIPPPTGTFPEEQSAVAY